MRGYSTTDQTARVALTEMTRERSEVTVICAPLLEGFHMELCEVCAAATWQVVECDLSPGRSVAHTSQRLPHRRSTLLAPMTTAKCAHAPLSRVLTAFPRTTK